MKIRYTELQAGAEHKAGELKSQEYSVSDLIIGRGGKSSIIIPDRSISLEHAMFSEASDGRLVIKDLGSLSGIRVNGQVQKQHVLSSGDNITVGNFDFKVLKDGDTWIIVHEKSSETAQKDTRTPLAPLTLAYYLPSNTTLSAALVATLLIIYGVRALISTVGVDSYSVGQLTSHHIFIGTDCSACHTEAFSPASDAGCATCHAVSNHFEDASLKSKSFFHDKTDGTYSCNECHTEHKGQVTLNNNAVCTSCHANIEQVQDVPLKNVSSWSNHPEFNTPADNGTIALNHAAHLKADIRGDKGSETLTCASCHTMDSRREKMLPVTYEANCARCHTLEFDERLPGMMVPHGSTTELLKTLQGAYANLALLGGTKFTKGDTERLKKTTTLDPPKFIQIEVRDLVRDAEELLFTKTGCVLCHKIDVTHTRDDVPQGASRYEIQKASVHSTWLPKAVFSHSAHGHMNCEACHGDVKNSKKSGDTLMPKLDNCSDCHASSEKLSNCVVCHSYHDSLPMKHVESKSQTK